MPVLIVRKLLNMCHTVSMQELHTPQKVARSSVTYTAALVYQKILSFTYFSIVARMLGPERLGTYIFALSFAAFFSLVVDFGFVPMVIRTFAQKAEDQVRSFRIFFGIRLVAAVIGVTLLFGTGLLLQYDRTLMTLIAITAVIMVMDAFTAFFYALFRSRQNLFYESIGTVIFQTIIFGAGIFTVYRTNDLRALLAVILLGSVWHIVYTSILLKRKSGFESLKPIFNIRASRLWLHRALPFFMTAGFIKAYNTIDTILIKNISGNEAVGLYAIPAKVVFTFPFVALAITAAVYPAMSSYAVHSKERLQRTFTRTLEILLAISMPIAVGIFLLADQIVIRIWPEFSGSVLGLQILIWAVIFLYIEYPFGSLLNATGRERQNTINRGIQLLVFVLLNVFLIPRFGFLGAVYAALGSSILIVLLGWFRARVIVQIFNERMVISLIKLILASGIMGVCIMWLRIDYSFLVTIPSAAVVYGALLFAFRFYTAEDARWARQLFKKGHTS